MPVAARLVIVEKHINGVIGVSTVRTAMRVRGHNGNLQNSVASTYVVSLYPALYIMYRR